MRTVLLSFVFVLASMNVAVSHEFWVSPRNYQPTADENIVADIRVGQAFKGGAYSFIPTNFARFELANDRQTIPVEGRIGDRPALEMPAPGEGLWIVVHETTDNTLTYSEWEKFLSFVEHKDLGDTVQQHLARNYPKTGFKEDYRRYAKSLIGVGNGIGQDREVGLLTEIVAQLNPYTDDLSAGMRVIVLYEGKPRTNEQVEIFDKAPSGEVTISTQRTDSVGHVTFPVLAGHEYLIDSVTMIPLQANDLAVEPVWKSLWASLTFFVPQ